MQRQPTPVLDKQRPSHFLSRKDALANARHRADALVDLTDLRSNVKDTEKEALKARSDLDANITKAVGLKSWSGTRVRSFVTCYHCGKRRGIYLARDDEYIAAMTALQQKLESVSERLYCGDLLFDDSHPLSRVLVQKQRLTCESLIENGHYSVSKRRLKLKPISYHCGEFSAPLEKGNLQKRCLTGD